MEHRTKRDLALYNLVSEFEVNVEKGEVKYLDVKSFAQLIDYYENEGAYHKAISAATIALRQFKYRAEFYITISHLLLKTDEAERALNYLEQAEAIAPYENEIILLRARALTVTKQYEEAFKCLENAGAYASVEDQVEIHVCEAAIYYEMKAFDRMYLALTAALDMDPLNEEALTRMLTATELSRNFIQSIDFHKDLIDKQPYNYLAWYNLASAMNYEGDYEEAAELMEYSYIINPDFEDGYLESADIYRQINKYDKALSIYEEAVEVFGLDSDLLTNIAECQLHIGLIKQAKHNLYKAIRLEPHSEELYYLLGECYSRQEKWYSAINAYHKAIDIEDGSEDYYLGLARAYIAVEEYNKATVNFQLAVSLGPELSKYWLEFSSFLIKMGLYDEALQILDEAEDFTFGADLLYARSLTYFFLGDKEQGIEALQEALMEDSEQHHILFTLAPELELDPEIASMIAYYAEGH